MWNAQTVAEEHESLCFAADPVTAGKCWKIWILFSNMHDMFRRFVLQESVWQQQNRITTGEAVEPAQFPGQVAIYYM